MSDVTLLGVIAAGLGVYCLHLQWKYRTIIMMFQVVLAGIYEGDAEIEKRGEVYFPISKKQ
jgi:hypothetical protein